MAVNSMTGFGRGRAERDGLVVTVELSAVNRKQFDLRVNVPRSLAVLEPKMAKLVRAVVSRGGITASVTLDRQVGAQQSLPVLNEACADAYVKAAQVLARRHGVDATLRARDLLPLPGVMQLPAAGDEDSDRVWPVLREALETALEGLLAMRASEGRALCRDVTRRLRRLQQLRVRVARRAPATVEHYRALLHKRLRGLNLEAGVALDATVAREVAVFADRCDIDEELVRLESHIAQCLALLSGDEPAGRPLEFLCQELLREMNTIGAKANDVKIAASVVGMKTQLEGLREQVQNLE